MIRYLCNKYFLMKILLVAATQAETSPLLRLLVHSSGTTDNPQKFFYKGIDIDLLITGVGMTATAFFLGKFLSYAKYDIALNMGVAGSFDKKLRIGDVVNVIQERFPEMGAEDGESFLSLYELNLAGVDETPFSEGVLKNKSVFYNKVISGLPPVYGVTVNTIHGNEDSIRSVIKRCKADVETMEGAAFLYACLSENIPCIEIRAISNYIERRNRDSWNIPLAIENLSKKVIQILDSIS